MKRTPTAFRPGPESGATRIDAAALTRSCRIAEVVQSYGLALSRAGKDLVGRCPFHPDARPAQPLRLRPDQPLVLLPLRHRRRRAGLRPAHRGRRLPRGRRHPLRRAPAHGPAARRRRRACAAARPRGGRKARVPEPDERDCLAAAVELYANRLLTEPRAIAYAARRGLDRATLERFRVGFAAGDELADLLRWRGLAVSAAVRAGLLHSDGRERFAGRIVVPELRGGAPVWLVGRTIDAGSDAPKYLGLPGSKPLLGWERVLGTELAVVVEGVFDLLVLAMWGLPAVALVGTHPNTAGLDELRRLRHLYVALDADAAGQAATAALVGSLGARATPVRLPLLEGVKDVADLATHPGGRQAFLAALADAAQTNPDNATQQVPGA